MGVCFVVMLGCLFLFWYFFFFDVYSSGIVRLFCFFLLSVIGGWWLHLVFVGFTILVIGVSWF